MRLALAVLVLSYSIHAHALPEWFRNWCFGTHKVTPPATSSPSREPGIYGPEEPDRVFISQFAKILKESSPQQWGFTDPHIREVVGRPDVGTYLREGDTIRHPLFGGPAKLETRDAQGRLSGALAVSSSDILPNVGPVITDSPYQIVSILGGAALPGPEAANSAHDLVALAKKSIKYDEGWVGVYLPRDSEWLPIFVQQGFWDQDTRIHKSNSTQISLVWEKKRERPKDDPLPLPDDGPKVELRPKPGKGKIRRVEEALNLAL